ncbi:MAG: FAD-dependent oxidoreductase [Elusimicrobiota bacterium]|nr:FAD-dependent oxidoreductase [Elusimicrobiota bacterium]
MLSSSRSSPLWPDTFRIPERSALAKSLTADVCVIGAGIAGLSVAYRLARAGSRVIVLDAGIVGGGETERTTAHLALALDEGYAELSRVHGDDSVRLVARSHAAAIDEIERVASEEGVDCGFERVDGWLFSSPNDPPRDLEEEYEASVNAGIKGVARADLAPLGVFLTGPAIRYPRQAQFHPLRYLAGLAAAYERLGGRIFCGTRVVEVRGGASARVETEKGLSVSAASIVIATNTPFNDRLVIHTKQASYRTYAVAAPLVVPGPRALFWDMEDPFHYARVQPGDDRRPDTLIVGGGDHKTGQADGAPEERFERLERWARERFEGMGAVSHRWSGQIIGTSDGIAYIGRNPGDEENVFIVTGDCGHGMTHGTIAGLMLPDLIAGRSHAWEKLYDPSRVRAGSLARWARENLNSAAQYAGHLAPAEVSSAEDIPPGSGAVLRRGFSRIAAYRDPDGTLTECSAVCPHLGAVVRWNSAERTWDCPAHGSRFDPAGRVLNGPAAAGLSPVKAASKPRRGVKRAAKKGLRRRTAPRIGKKTG